MEEQIVVLAPNVVAALIAIAAMGGAFVTWVVMQIRKVGTGRFEATIRRRR